MILAFCFNIFYILCRKIFENNHYMKRQTLYLDHSQDVFLTYIMFGNSLARQSNNWSVKYRFVRLENNFKYCYYWIDTTDLYYWIDTHPTLEWIVVECTSQQGNVISRWTNNWLVNNRFGRLNNNSKDVYYWIYTTGLCYWKDTLLCWTIP